MACPVVSSVCHAWLRKARKMATHRSAVGKWNSSPPSCQTPSSLRNRSLFPWFMWMSCTPFPGRKPKILSGVLASGPHRSPNT